MSVNITYSILTEIGCIEAATCTHFGTFTALHTTHMHHSLYSYLDVTTTFIVTLYAFKIPYSESTEKKLKKKSKSIN